MLKKSWTLLFLCIVFYCLDYYFRIVPGLVVPELMQQYHSSALGIGAFASAFYFGYLIFQIPAGILLDNFSLRRIIPPMILICSLTFIIFLYLHNFWLGWSARFIIGASSAFSFIGVLWIARQYLPANQFSFISGLAIGICSIFASLGQYITAFFINDNNWQFVFAALACIGLVIATLIFFSKHQQETKINTKQTSVKQLWREVILLLKNPQFTLNGIIGGLFYLPTSLLATTWGVPFLTTEYHLSRPQASMGILLLFLGWAIGAPVVGKIADRMPNHKYLIGSASFMAALLSLLLIFDVQQVGHNVYWGFFLLGIFSSTQVLIWKTFRQICPPNIVGTGVACTNMVIMAVSALLNLLVGYLLINPQHIHQIGDLQHGLLVLPIVFFAATILPYFAMKTYSD